jgi:rSAM/selenodomain-associated transferase 1
MSQETLIIFTRYPEPGITKTRMIPILGATGAANLQRQMTETTVNKGKKLVWERSIELMIYFSGGNKDLIQTWLGQDLNYHSQSQGDLGQRMSSAFAEAFAMGRKRVVLIGIDCPKLNTILLNQAFALLSQQDLILGPALDGGYYLIGLNRWLPELFIGIAWGTETVFLQTQVIANKLSLKVDYLPMLRDVDRPEDLIQLSIS